MTTRLEQIKARLSAWFGCKPNANAALNDNAGADIAYLVEEVERLGAQIAEINAALDWFEATRDAANTRADLEALNGLALFKIGRVVGHKYKEEKKC